jgi:hypothetical protein
MNFTNFLLNYSALIVALICFAILLSVICIYLLFNVTKLVQRDANKLINTEKYLQVIEKNNLISNIFAIALINSSQTKNSIELSRLLLSYCKYKSDVLTGKAVENSLSVEISNAVIAVEALEEKRALLEGKIKQLYEQLHQQKQLLELEQTLSYAQTLQQETELEFISTEKIKLNVLKVNEVLDDVLLKLQ